MRPGTRGSFAEGGGAREAIVLVRERSREKRRVKSVFVVVSVAAAYVWRVRRAWRM